MATPGRITVVKKSRLWIAAGFVFAVLAGVIWVPFPHHVSCLLELRPREAISVYVTTAGRLDKINTSAGTAVVAGTVLGTLHNGELAQQMLELNAKKAMLDSQIKSVSFYTGSSALDARRQLRQMQESLRSIQEQIVEKQREQDFLTLSAPVAGTILPPPLIRSSADDEESLLPTWSGSPLEPQNLGAWLPTRTLFCQIGDPAKWEAILLVDQADMDFVRVDQEVAIKLDGLPHRTFVGKISAISPADLKRTPHEPSQKNAAANAAKSADSAEHSTTISYEARVPLNDDELLFLRGIRGRAKIDAQNLSLGDRLWRYLAHTFRFSP
jgi:putative peptide zinc metalloprotease protein